MLMHTEMEPAAPTTSTAVPTFKTPLDGALWAVRIMGWHIFPMSTRGVRKVPLITKWPTRASNKERAILAWAKKFPGCSWGVACGKSKICCIDSDEQEGRANLTGLELDYELLPDTIVQETPRGGQHHIMADPLGLVPTRTHTLAKKIDTRGPGGLFVLAGSRRVGTDKTYRLTHVPAGPLPIVPRWILDIAGENSKRPGAPQEPLVELDQEHHIELAIRYLRNAEAAVEGDGGDGLTLRVAARLKDLAISEPTAVELMLAYYNDRCSPPWGVEELERKTANAYRYCRQSAPGCATAEAAFAEVIDEYDDLFAMPEFVEKERKEKALEEDKPPVSNKKDLLKWMNKRHAVVFLENKLRITKEVHDGEQTKTKYITAQDFKVAYQKYLVADGQYQNGNPKFKPLGEWWLDNPNRREPKHGAGFWPPGAKTPGDAYNTWNGYAVKPSVPDPARFSLYKELVEQILCGGNEEYINYTWDWVAHTIVQPGKGKPTVAIVLLGEEGTGKGMFVRYLQKILGRHAVQVTDQKHLIGSFNAHFDSRVLIYADEAFWAGDKSREGNLKGILSEDHISLERKGIDHQDIRSFHSFIFASNDSWAVPASVRARRFFVLEVLNDRQQDDEWFGRLKHQMEEEGGVEALLAWLTARDLSRANLRRVPKTEALTKQKEQSLPQEAQWCKELLEAKRLPEPIKPVTLPKDATDEDHEDAKWTAPIPKTRLYEAFMARCKTRNIKVPWNLGPEALCVAMAKIFGGANKSRPRNDIGEQEKCLSFKSHEECWEAYWRYVRGDK